MTFIDTVPQAAAELDRVMPGWYTRINLESLDMSHGRHCILGQLYGSYENSPTSLRYPNGVMASIGRSVFGCSQYNRPAWEAAIRERFARDTRTTTARVDIDSNGYIIEPQPPAQWSVTFETARELELFKLLTPQARVLWLVLEKPD